MPSNVLLVDDEPTNLRILDKMLEPLGVVRHFAQDGREALAIAESVPLDLVLLDVRMPGLDGIDVLTHLRARADWVPVILVTASHEREDRLRGIEAGADDFLEKPVDRPVLLARVRTLLRLKDATNEVGRRNAQLEQLVRRQRELMGVLSHDLKNPLTAVHTNLRYARQVMPEQADDVADAIEDAAEASRRVVGLAESLVAVSLLEQGEYAVRVARIDVAQLLEDVKSQFMRESRLRKVTLAIEMPATLDVDADLTLVRRALENLVDLALREAPTDGSVQLAAANGDTVRFSVSRTGTAPAGDPKALLESLMHVSKDGRNAGNAVALHLCQHAALVHGGGLRLESLAPWAVRYVMSLPRRGGLGA